MKGAYVLGIALAAGFVLYNLFVWVTDLTRPPMSSPSFLPWFGLMAVLWFGGIVAIFNFILWESRKTFGIRPVRPSEGSP